MMRRASLVLAVASVAVVVDLLADPTDRAAACSPAPNDDFSNAQVISSLPFGVDVSWVCFPATFEAEEPNPCGLVGGSMWYAYTSDANQLLTAVFRGRGGFHEGYETTIAVYSGSSLVSLAPLGCGTGFVGGIDFVAVAGSTYYFQVDTRSSDFGLVASPLTPTPTPTTTTCACPTPTPPPVGGVALDARASGGSAFDAWWLIALAGMAFVTVGRVVAYARNRGGHDA